MDELELKSLVEKKLSEIEIYKSQGLIDAAHEIAIELYEKIGKSQIPEDKKNEYLRKIENASDTSINSVTLPEAKPKKEEPDSQVSHGEELRVNEENPESQFQYARALMEIQDWEGAIEKFKEVAATGYRIDECYELCGDCAAKAGKWQDAINYYEIVYSQPGLSSEDKERILNKLSRCQKEKFVGKVRSDSTRSSEEIFSEGIDEKDSRIAEHLDTLYGYVGKTLVSWKDSKGYSLAGEPLEYELKELLHFGYTHVVFEVLCKNTGYTYAANALVAPWNECVSLRDVIEWVYVCKMMNCEYIDIPLDIAISDDMFFVIRNYYRYSLYDYVKHNPHPLYDEACIIAYQILEGLGYLHLHLGSDKQKRKIYHLDLRPSRVFINDPLKVRVAYGGLWKIFNDRCGKYTTSRNLPLAFLPYKAPEQFRRYLWSEKRPQICVDVYSFGVIFYELLTGINPFEGKSAEEYEVLHCDQKPIPPQVARPDLPEELNNIVMKCLEVRPQKRWRSTTQILLAVEKFLGGATRVKELLKKYSGIAVEFDREYAN